MVSITAKDASILFPLIGPDKRFIKGASSNEVSVGGKIIRGKEAGILAIDCANIKLEDGDRLGIFGHNGSGKSTLLRMLAGIYPPTSGSVKIVGSTAGMFSLNLGVNKEATGLQNIEFKGLMRGMTKQEIAEVVPEVAAFSELGDYLHLPVKTYSSGMVMRLMFATASMLKPDILLLDEWVSAGDGAFRDKARKYLDQILETSKIVVIASQNEGRLREWANKLVFLEHGRSMPPPEPKLRSFKPSPEDTAEFRRLTNSRQFEQSLSVIDRVWPEAITPVQNFQQKATALLRMENFEDALAQINKALSIEPENANLFNLKGRLLSKMKRSSDAVDAFLSALLVSDGIVGDVPTLLACAKASDRLKDVPAECLAEIGN